MNIQTKISTPNKTEEKNSEKNFTRREFFSVSTSASMAFTLAINLPLGNAYAAKDTAQAFEPNAFIKIHKNNEITFLIKHLDMGQGAFTGLSTLLAEELDADWDVLRAEHAPADLSKYAHLGWGPTQGTGGSAGLKDAYMQMRQAGAAAKSMLMNAAAEMWKTDLENLTAEKSHILNKKNGQKAPYGTLATLAAKQPVPELASIKLKDPKDFIYIGKPVRRLDQGKENGTAIFTQDIQLPNMLTAVVAHSAKFGSSLKSFDATDAKKIKGVVDVVKVPNGVAVVAENFWLAKKGRDALQVEWDESAAECINCNDLMDKYKEFGNKEGNIAFQKGDITEGMENSKITAEMEFEFPYLAHAPMEPMNCVSLVTDQGCEIWSGVQTQSTAQNVAAGILGIKPEQVKINTLFAGGSFGRRGNIIGDYIQESVEISKQFKGIPVKMVWTREDDTNSGWLRPMYYHKLKAGLDNSGKISAWDQTIVGQSILLGTVMAGWGIKDGVDVTTVDGLEEIPYEMDSYKVQTHNTNDLVKVTTLWWRAVGNTHTALAKEVMIDRLAKEAKQDPVAFRLAKLDPNSRDANVLKLATEKAAWDKPLPKGWGRGVAVHKSFDTYVAQVAEVSTDDKGGFKVERVVCAVDCGVPVNPSIIEAQMQGGIGFGLAAVLSSEITVRDGQVQESNFNAYEVLRMNQMPKIEVHIVNSSEPPSGVGEPGTSVIAPTVVNALANATGKFYTKLPIRTLS